MMMRRSEFSSCARISTLNLPTLASICLQLDADAEFVAQQFEVFRLGEPAGEIERFVRPLVAE